MNYSTANSCRDRGQPQVMDQNHHSASVQSQSTPIPHCSVQYQSSPFRGAKPAVYNVQMPWAVSCLCQHV